MNRSECVLSRLGRARSGAVMVEAALMLPLILLGFAAFVDVSRYFQLSARADRMASTLSDVVSRSDEIRDRSAFDAQSQSSDTGTFFEVARVMAEPEDLARGGVVLASVTGSGVGATLNWARSSGPGAAVDASRLSAVGALPAGMPFIVAEVFLPFDPIVFDREDLLGAVGFDRVIYRRALFRPRAAALTTLAPAS